ncbi:MAG: tRNA pseudouridine(38-40) synthase TruA [Simkaniaceae bacterium]
MPRYKLTISYDGTSYGGWQIQPNTPTIQASIEAALKTCLGSDVKVIGSGRTDQGVHAHAQIAHFDAPKPLEEKKVQYSLNGILPKCIRIHTLELVSDDFHARFSAKRKIYTYHLFTSPVRPPFLRLTSYHVRGRFDKELFMQASKRFIGTHDFTSFTNESTIKHPRKNAIRTIYRLDIIEDTDGLMIEIEGNGFLYKMVRNIVGTLLDIAKGKISIENLDLIFTGKDRKLAGKSASPQGLFLKKVIYSS